MLCECCCTIVELMAIGHLETDDVCCIVNSLMMMMVHLIRPLVRSLQAT